MMMMIDNPDISIYNDPGNPYDNCDRRDKHEGVVKELQLSKTSLSELETTLENLQLTSDDTTRGLRQEVNINIYIYVSSSIIQMMSI